VRTLLVAERYPWPQNSGSRLRLGGILRGLSRCGPVDLFSVLPATRTDVLPPPDDSGLDRMGWTTFDTRPPAGLARLATVLRWDTPFELARPDGGAALRSLTRFARGPYDLVWYFRIRAFALVGGVLAAPTVLDLDDLEDHKIAAQVAVPGGDADRPGDRARRSLSRALAVEEARRWRRLQAGAASRVDATVVCSELDAGRARRAGVARVEVVPNGYRLVDDPVGQTAVHDPPTVLFAGTLQYPPNADGARFLVGEVGPALRRLVPDARIRLVGRTTPALAALDDPPRVRVVGQVPEMADELASTDVVVVPLRFGSGTRLKILEAFAQRVPVVSTTLGAEGLGAEDDVHLLVADSAGGLAEACARLLEDAGLRHRLVDRAHALFRERFSDDVVSGEIAALARRVAGSSGVG